ncbi:unnamed protein product [Owenia fusiformis]|uniref:Uncharacterized protein n=1 Tax=Owenia fusiformis TaxID=6347 RepID=A0A8S4PX53_OWEFU|nr:unnamed protein product [Owenia fusiformis]
MNRYSNLYLYLYIVYHLGGDVIGGCPSSSCSCYEKHWARDMTDSLSRGLMTQCQGQGPVEAATGTYASLSDCDQACTNDGNCTSYNYNFKTLQCDGWSHVSCTTNTSLDEFNYWFFANTQNNKGVSYYDPYETCYWISEPSDTRTYTDAQNQCETLGGQLAEIDIEDENIFLQHNPPPNSNGYVWIGLSNDPTIHGSLGWNNGTAPEFENWALAQNPLENYCVKADTNDGFKWSLETCSMALQYMCEKTEGQCHLLDEVPKQITSTTHRQASIDKPYSCSRSCYLDSECSFAMFDGLYYTCDFVNFGDTSITLANATILEIVFEKVCPDTSNTTETTPSTQSSTTSQNSSTSPTSPTSQSTPTTPSTQTTPTTPTDAPVFCQDPDAINAGVVSAQQQYTAGTIIQLECLNMFSKEGGFEEIECQSDGSWSEEPLKCQPEEFTCDFESDICGLTEQNGVTEWHRKSGETEKWDKTGTDTDHTYGIESGFYMWYRRKDHSDKYDIARMLTQVNWDGQEPTLFCMDFWYRLFGRTDQASVLNVYVVDSSGNEDMVWGDSKDTNEEWQFKTLMLGARNSFRIMFEGRGGKHNEEGDIVVDDIRIYGCNSDPVATVSWPCTFEDGSLCMFKHDPDDDLDWRIHHGETPTHDTGPYTDHTLQTNVGQYLYMEASPPASEGDVARLVSYVQQPHSESRMCFRVYYSANGDDIGSLALKTYYPDDPNPTEHGEQYRSNSFSGWSPLKVTLDMFKPVQIIIQATRGQGEESDIAVDDADLFDYPCDCIDYCNNGGTCKDSVDHISKYCVCMEGFTGTRCETSMPCGEAPEAPSASMSYSNQYERAYYSCHQGFQIEGSNQLDCSGNEWPQQVPFTCNVKVCGQPNKFVQQYTEYTGTNFTYSSSVFLNCKPGYEYWYGDTVRTCNQYQQWDGAYYNCKVCRAGNDNPTYEFSNKYRVATIHPGHEFNCTGQLDRVQYYASNTGRFFATIWRPEDSNYRLVWKYEIEALQTGSQSEIIPANASLSIQTGDVIGYHYDASNSPIIISLNKPSEIECWFELSLNDAALPLGYVASNPEWAVNVGTPALKAFAKPFSCDRAEAITNGDRNNYMQSPPVGSIVIYTCRSGFRHVMGNLTRHCLMSSYLPSWSGSLPTCEGCPELNNINNGTVHASYFGVWGTANYNCDDGFRIRSPYTSQRTCQQDFTWSNQEPKCENIDCYDPTPVPNSDIAGPNPNTREGATVQYNCNVGYLHLEGDLSRTCTFDEQTRFMLWSGRTPVCGLPLHPVALWPLVAKTNLDDVSGYANPATITPSTPDFVNSEMMDSDVYNFDGNSIIDFTISNSINSFTLMFSTKVIEDSLSFKFISTTLPDPVSYLSFTPTNLGGQTYITFSHGDPLLASTFSWNGDANNWIRFALSYDGNDNTLTIYINGVSQVEETLEWNIEGTIQIRKDTTAASEGFKGYLACVQVFDTALSETAIPYAETLCSSYQYCSPPNLNVDFGYFGYIDDVWYNKTPTVFCENAYELVEPTNNQMICGPNKTYIGENVGYCKDAPGELRIIGSKYTTGAKGMLEMLYLGSNWLPICRDAVFDWRAADVACKQLGYDDGFILQPQQHTHRQVYIERFSNMVCDGSERGLRYCSWSYGNNCSPNDQQYPYIGLQCTNETLDCSEGTAPEGKTWQKYEERCFLVNEESSTFDEARSQCENTYGGHLAVLREADVNQFVAEASTVNPDNIDNKYWIGLQVDASGALVWANGESMGNFFNMDPDDFTSLSDPDTCGVLSSTLWSLDEQCTSNVDGYICERTASIRNIPYVPDRKECRDNSTGFDYTGTLNVTQTGESCTYRWDDLLASFDNISHSLFPDRTVNEASNFCRQITGDVLSVPNCVTQLDYSLSPPKPVFSPCAVQYCSGCYYLPSVAQADVSQKIENTTVPFNNDITTAPNMTCNQYYAMEDETDFLICKEDYSWVSHSNTSLDSICKFVGSCHPQPCQNDGNCTSHYQTPSIYACTCFPGYTGVNCETDIDECSSSPCQNGGTCNNLLAQFTCDCPIYTNGSLCETSYEAAGYKRSEERQDCSGSDMPGYNGGVPHTFDECVDLCNIESQCLGFLFEFIDGSVTETKCWLKSVACITTTPTQRPLVYYVKAKRSCYEWHLQGYIDDQIYVIDPDGDGILEPFRVMCTNMEMVGGTAPIAKVTPTNDIFSVPVTSSQTVIDHVISYDDITIDQLRALVENSETCQQEMLFYCSDIVIWDTSDTQRVWWISHDSRQMSYWGNGSPQNNTCGCGLDDSCPGGGKCKCDNSSGVRYVESGAVQNNDDLPVSGFHVEIISPTSQTIIPYEVTLKGGRGFPWWGLVMLKGRPEYDLNGENKQLFQDNLDTWSPVCDGYLNNTHAELICNEMGLRGGHYFPYVNPSYGLFHPQQSPYKFDHFSCQGNEDMLGECNFEPVTTCVQYANVICSPNECYLEKHTGIVLNTLSYLTMTTSDYDECNNACLDNTECVGTQFIESGNTCYLLYSIAIEESIEADGHIVNVKTCPVTSPCDSPSWTYLGNHTNCVYISHESTMKTDAAFKCEKMGGRLAEIGDEELLIEIMPLLGPANKYWIGLDYSEASSGPLWSSDQTSPEAAFQFAHIDSSNSGGSYVFERAKTRQMSRQDSVSTFPFICQETGAIETHATKMAEDGAPKCRTPPELRVICGWPDIDSSQCLLIGCCYSDDDVGIGVPSCYTQQGICTSYKGFVDMKGNSGAVHHVFAETIDNDVWVSFGKQQISGWNFIDSTENTEQMTFLEQNDMNTLIDLPKHGLEVDTDLDFRLKADNSFNPSYITVSGLGSPVSSYDIKMNAGNDNTLLGYDTMRVSCATISHSSTSCGLNNKPANESSTSPLFIWGGRFSPTDVNLGASALNDNWSRNMFTWNVTKYVVKQKVASCPTYEEFCYVQDGEYNLIGQNLVQSHNVSIVHILDDIGAYDVWLEFGVANQSWTFEDESTENFTVDLLSNVDLDSIRDFNFEDFMIYSDVKMSVQTDGSQHKSNVSGLMWNSTGKPLEHGEYLFDTSPTTVLIQLTKDKKKLRCQGYHCEAEIGITNGTSPPIILKRIGMIPQDGAIVIDGDYTRNKYTFKGSYYLVRLKLQDCPQSCGPSENLTNGFIERTDHKIIPGSNLTYACHYGYDLDGIATRECSTDGVWESPMPSCIPRDCLYPTLGDQLYSLWENSSMPQPTTYENTWNLACNPGYTLIGNDSIICQGDANWTSIPYCKIKDCGNLHNGSIRYGQISDGSSNLTTFNEIVYFECDLNYFSYTQLTVQCTQHGNWSDVVPECIANCSVPIVEFANEDYSNGIHIEGMSVNFTCITGFNMTGNPESVCLETTMWSELPACSPLDCQTAPVIDNGMHSFLNLEGPYPYSGEADETLFNAIYQFTCDEGYENLDNVEMKFRCDANASWTPMPYCQLKDCGGFGNVSNSTYQPESPSTTYGSAVIFTCDPGFDMNLEVVQDAMTPAVLAAESPETPLIEDGTIVCRSNSTWSSLPTCVIKDCGNVTILNAHRTDNNPFTTAFQTIQFECDTGFELDSDGSVTCLATGNWSVLPSCHPMNCGQLPIVANSSFNFTTILHSAVEVYFNGSDDGMSHYGAQYQFYCDEGYDPIGNTTVECNSTGFWSSLPYCQIRDCGAPNTVHNSTTYPTNFSTTYLSVVTYICDTGYDMVGNESIECMYNTSWTIEPLCKIKDCGNPEGIDNAFQPELEFENTTVYQSLAFYECNIGYTMFGNNTIRCDENGNWTNVPFCNLTDCNSPHNIKNGTYTTVAIRSEFNTTHNETTSVKNDTALIDDPPLETTYESVFLYSCDPGFSMTGDPLVVCNETGNWSSIPHCIIKDCQNPPHVNNSDIHPIGDNMTTYGSVVEYECHVGYTMEGNATILCEDTGTWSMQPVCEINDCGPSSNISGGMNTMPNASTVYGSSVKYVCDPGYTMWGNDTIYCTANGTWEDFPLCDQIDCGEINITGGVAEYMNDSYVGSFAYISCSVGYELSGNGTMYCDINGNWQGHSNCSMVGCGRPPEVKNALVRNATSHEQFTYEEIILGTADLTTMYGSLLEYLCFPGYDLWGDSELWCQQEGFWTPTPECNPKDCGEATVEFPLIEDGGDDTTTFGSIKNYTCAYGFEIAEEDFMVCNENGSWTKTPTCQQIYCTVDPAIYNATFYILLKVYSIDVDRSEQEIKYTTEMPYETSPMGAYNYSTFGSGSNEESVFEWSGSGASGSGNMGDINFIKAEYSGGDVGSADSELIIMTPATSYMKYKFIKLDSENITTSVVNLTVDSIVVYSCVGSAVMVGRSNMTCLPNGTLSSPPECLPNCGPPPPYPFTSFSSSKGIQPNAAVSLLDNSTLYRSVAQFTCTTRYFGVAGVDKITCRLSGKWSIEDIVKDCKFVNCGDFPDVKKATIIHEPRTTYLGEQILYECSDGLYLSPNMPVVCTKYGRWAPIPKCYTRLPDPVQTSKPDGTGELAERGGPSQIIQTTKNPTSAMTTTGYIETIETTTVVTIASTEATSTYVSTTEEFFTTPAPVEVYVRAKRVEYPPEEAKNADTIGSPWLFVIIGVFAFIFIIDLPTIVTHMKTAVCDIKSYITYKKAQKAQMNNKVHDSVSNLTNINSSSHAAVTTPHA